MLAAGIAVVAAADFVKTSAGFVFLNIPRPAAGLLDEGPPELACLAKSQDAGEANPWSEKRSCGQPANDTALLLDKGKKTVVVDIEAAHRLGKVKLAVPSWDMSSLFSGDKFLWFKSTRVFGKLFSIVSSEISGGKSSISGNSPLLCK
jgi:hypothetical protein